MAPAAATTTKKATSTKKAGSAPAHASYKDMIKEAILALKERNGSSRQAIKKYIKANNNLGATTDTQFSGQINRALATGEKNGDFARPKGASGPVKLAKKETKKPASKEEGAKATKKTTKKADGTKKTTKKADGTKKASATKATTKKTATKANASKPRKTAAPKAAPAVVDKPPVVLGKTKSGRVTKTKAPVAPAKKAAAKKAAPKKAAGTKKAAASA